MEGEDKKRSQLKGAAAGIRDSTFHASRGLYDITRGSLELAFDKTKKYTLPILTTAGGVEIGGFIGEHGSDLYNGFSSMVASKMPSSYSFIDLGNIDPQTAQYVGAGILGVLAFGYGYNKMKKGN